MKDIKKLKLNSRPIHAGPEADPVNGAVSVPIYQTSTFSFTSPDQGANRFAGTEAGYIYTRLGNPTIRALEQAVAELRKVDARDDVAARVKAETERVAAERAIRLAEAPFEQAHQEITAVDQAIQKIHAALVEARKEQAGVSDAQGQQ